MFDRSELSVCALLLVGFLLFCGVVAKCTNESEQTRLKFMSDCVKSHTALECRVAWETTK